MIRLIVGLLCLVLALPATAQELPALFRVTGVAAGDVLNIRAGPSAGAEVIGALAPGAAGIEVVALSADGRWGQVNSGEGAGWSAMRFLTPEPGPGWRSGAAPLACFGTEPFWRLDLFLPSHRAEFHGLDTGGFELVTEAGALPGTRFPPTLAIPFAGARRGMAVLRGEACNDGMSDMAFGIGVQIYWRGDREGLSGCCRLMP